MPTAAEPPPHAAGHGYTIFAFSALPRGDYETDILRLAAADDSGGDERGIRGKLEGISGLLFARVVGTVYRSGELFGPKLSHEGLFRCVPLK